MKKVLRPLHPYGVRVVFEWWPYDKAFSWLPRWAVGANRSYLS